jgi:DNA-binding CsgD family transcriptional regulator/PAS domain-containing protein
MESLERFSEILESIYDAALDPSLWKQALVQIAIAARSSHACLTVFDRSQGRHRYFMATLDEAPSRAIEGNRHQIDSAVVARREARGKMMATAGPTMSEQCPREEPGLDIVYPGDVEHSMIVHVLDSAIGFCSLAIGSRLHVGTVAEPETLRVVRLLVPHLRRAVQAQLSLGCLSLVRDGAIDVVDQFHQGFLLVCEKGEVLYANRAANDITAAHDGLALGARGLRAERASENTTLQRLIQLACIGTEETPRADGCLAVSRPSGRKPYAVKVVPLRPDRAILLGDPPAATVLIFDPERATHLRPLDLQSIFGLTRAEAAVAIQVVEGQQLQAVADALHITLSTVRIHLQRVFEKTETHRQAELVRLLVNLEASCFSRRSPWRGHHEVDSDASQTRAGRRAPS